jgi:hypothetical protein
VPNLHVPLHVSSLFETYCWAPSGREQLCILGDITETMQFTMLNFPCVTFVLGRKFRLSVGELTRG